jgi:hypothetical protein
VGARLAKQHELVEQALSTVAGVAAAGQVTACSLRGAGRLGDFPLVSELLAQRFRPRYRKIVEVLGSEWLDRAARRLRHRTFVVGPPGEPGAFLLEGSSLATDTAEEEEYLDTPLGSSRYPSDAEPAPSLWLRLAARARLYP